MANFRSGRDSGFRGRSDNRGFGGRRDGGFGRGRDRDRKPEMHDVTCDKCKKECQVPFKPTGDKPVLCSDCFRKEGNPRGDSRTSGISQEQFKQINTKLDKIIEILETIEVEDEEESDKE